MNAEAPPDQDRRGDGAGAGFRSARTRLPGSGAVASSARPHSTLFAKEGLPHRRVEEWKYTDLRALMRDAKPLAGRPTPRPRRAPRSAGAFSATSRRGGSFLSTARSLPELSDIAALEQGLTIRRSPRRWPR